MCSMKKKSSNLFPKFQPYTIRITAHFWIMAVEENAVLLRSSAGDLLTRF